jgi:hypothetical protein
MRLLSTILRLTMRAAGVVAASLLLTSIVYAAPAPAADPQVCDPPPDCQITGFSPIAEEATSVSVVPTTDAAFQRATTLDDDDQDPIQQDDAPALGLPGAEPFAWSLELAGRVASSTARASLERGSSRRSPRGPPPSTLPL